MVGGTHPEQRGREPEALIAQLTQRLQVGRSRQNAARSAHAEHLEHQGQERRKVDQAESAKKEPAWEQTVTRAVVAIKEEIQFAQRLGHGLVGWGQQVSGMGRELRRRCRPCARLYGTAVQRASCCGRSVTVKRVPTGLLRGEPCLR